VLFRFRKFTHTYIHTQSSGPSGSDDRDEDFKIRKALPRVEDQESVFELVQPCEGLCVFARALRTVINHPGLVDENVKYTEMAGRKPSKVLPDVQYNSQTSAIPHEVRIPYHLVWKT
jgi:hypothetical protein